MEDLKLHGLIGSGESNIKSIQTGTITLTGSSMDVPISNVDINKTLVYFEYKTVYKSTSNWAMSIDSISIELINSTTLKFERENNDNASENVTLRWHVIEFKNVKSKQVGTATYNPSENAVVSKDIAITNVNPQKTISFMSWHQTKWGNPQYTADAFNRSSVVTNESNLSVTFYGAASCTLCVKWQVLEFN